MALLRNDKLNNLNPFVAEVTKGEPFIFWAESFAQSLVDKVTGRRGEVDINAILILRNIVVHELLNTNIVTAYKASLVNNLSQYDLYLDFTKISSEGEKKFILAHEIAHTLFYTNKDEGLRKRISLSFGSEQIENICDYIAICLLLPKSFIKEEISLYLNDKEDLRKRNENYLKLIFHLAAKYQVDWHYVSYRLIVNFGFLQDSLSIEFIKRDKWYIPWIYQTDSLTNRNLLIPNKSKSKSKFVSATKSFVDILQKIEDKTLLEPNVYGNIIIEKSHFDSYYQGNIKQFLLNHFTHELNILKIYYRVNANRSVLMLFPFAGLLR